MDTLVISTPPGFVSLALPLLSLSLSLSGGGETETEGGAAEEGTRRIPATEREFCGGGRGRSWWGRGGGGEEGDQEGEGGGEG